MNQTNQTGVKTDVQVRAQAVMNIYVQNHRAKKSLEETIATAKKSHDEKMKAAEKELLEIARLYPDMFDAEGNFNLGDGYIHIGSSTVVVIGKKFDAKKFAKEFPEMFDLAKAFKIDPLKKGFLDVEVRKELKGHGVQLGTEEELQVKIRKEGSTKLPG